MPLALIGSFGFQELLLILVIVVFLFGAKRIPEIAKGLGEGIRSFRSAMKSEDPEPPSKPNEASKRSEP